MVEIKIEISQKTLKDAISNKLKASNLDIEKCNAYDLDTK